MNSFSKIISFFMLLMSFFILSCRGSAPIYHLREDVDMSFFKRAAVMPFDNLSNDKAAGEVVRHLVISELLASGLVDVLVPGEVMAAVNELDIKNISSLSEKQIKALGKLLKVEALIIGTVEQYGETRIGNVSAPEVTVTLMMADTGTGNIIWSITLTRGGAGFMARYFGAKAETMSETALAVVREALSTLKKY
ncbi:MAG: hypothetical protein HZA14_00290 [Nitrospirae bacterium]|nr:hypothetical protein [Nitrospirota bacterium]